MYLQMKRAALLQWALKKNKSAYSESLWSGWNPPITWKSPSEEKNLESDRVILTWILPLSDTQDTPLQSQVNLQELKPSISN